MMYGFLLMGAIIGFVIRHKAHDIKRNFYRGYTRLVFFDTGDVINVYGRSKTYKTKRFGDEREFIIDENKTRRDTLILNSKLDETVKFKKKIKKF